MCQHYWIIDTPLTPEPDSDEKIPEYVDGVCILCGEVKTFLNRIPDELFIMANMNRKPIENEDPYEVLDTFRSRQRRGLRKVPKTDWGDIDE